VRERRKRGQRDEADEQILSGANGVAPGDTSTVAPENDSGKRRSRARVAARTLTAKFFARCDFKEQRRDAHASWALTAGVARPQFAYIYDAREWVGLREFWRIFK
jgi:hypothetical protein